MIELNVIGIATGLFAVTRTTDLAPEYTAPVDASDGVWPWVIAAITLAVIVAAVYYAIRRMRIPSMPMSDDLTLELCRAHKIGLQHRSSLDHVAQLAGLKSPAAMFLSEQFFDDVVTQACQAKPLGPRQRGLIFEVRQCLYN